MKGALSCLLASFLVITKVHVVGSANILSPARVSPSKTRKLKNHPQLPLFKASNNNAKIDVAAREASSSVSSGLTHHHASPLLLRPWIHLYRTTPTVHVPYTNLDVAFTIASAILLTCIDYGSAQLLQLAGWPAKSKHTRAVAGSIATIFHSTVLVLGLGAAFSSQKYDPSGKMADHPDWWQDGAHALIQFCTGYMCYDAAVQFIADRWQKGVGPVLSKSDYMFLGHHAATSLYMLSARLCEAGHMSAMVLMFTGEFTAPIMNVLRISRTAVNEMKGDCCGRSFFGFIRPYVEYLFALLYAAFRIVIGPICAAHLTYDILLTKRGRRNVPVAISSVWLVLVWGVLYGSIPWIKTALNILQAGLSTGDSSVPTRMGAE